MTDTGTPDIRTLISQCEHGDAQAKIEAMIALKDENARQAVPCILPLLADVDEDVRGTAARVLGQLGDAHVEQIGPALQALLSDTNDSTRNHAAESLGRLRYVRARSALERMLLHDDYWVARASAAEALGELGEPDALAALEAALGDEEDPVRSYAAHAVGRLGGEAQLPVIRRRLAVEAEPGARADLLAVALRFGDQSAFDELLDLIKGVDAEFAYDMFRVVDDLMSERIPAEVLTRAAELDLGLATLGPRAGVYEDYAAQLRARLAELVGNSANEKFTTAP